jgi:hypothetical protein
VIRTAFKLRCLDYIFDPVRDYLDGLRWDGVKRLDCWLVRYCGAEDTPLNRAIGRKMLVAAVRRVREPGCRTIGPMKLPTAQRARCPGILRHLECDRYAPACRELIVRWTYSAQNELPFLSSVCAVKRRAGICRLMQATVRIRASTARDGQVWRGR